jgi:hypothetical protein
LQIHALQQNPAYNYNRELMARQETLWDWLKMKFAEWLNDFLGNSVSVGVRNALLAFIGVLVVGLIVWFLYKYRPELFMRNSRDAKEEDNDENETIYGIDFDTEIAKALAASNYRQAVRYLYLKTLRRLSDAGHINWQPSKTPSQYVYEVQRDEFRQLTQHFLRVRYGNFEATRELYDEMLRLSKEGGGE